MDLIEPSEELTIEQIAELLARKLLINEQNRRRAEGDTATLQNVGLLARNAKDVGHVLIHATDAFVGGVYRAIDECAGEYTR